MRITGQTVKHIAKLSRLNLNDEEVELMSTQLSTIISYVEKLNKLDTSDVEPTSHVIPLQNVMRDDVCIPSLLREKALINAPDASENFYRVLRIIE